MNKFVRWFSCAFFSVVYIFMWLLIFQFATLSERNGMFVVFIDTFGRWIVPTGYFIATLIFVSPVLLLVYQIKTQKTIKIYLISFFMTILFCVLSVASFYCVCLPYLDFDEYKWRNAPNERFIMYNDMRKHITVGMERKNVDCLLGAPDEVLKNENVYVYEYGEYGEIEIIFDNDKVKNIYLH